MISMIGDPVENFYQLGLKEKDSFLMIEERATKLVSASEIFRLGNNLLTRTKTILKKQEVTFFDQCVSAYAEGLGVGSFRYQSFLSIFEIAARYGQIYPELKGMLPGCTSLFEKKDNEMTHTRLMDFPLSGFFEKLPRIYYWQTEGREPVLSYSCEGLAPLFFQGLHGSGVSFALHHKPANSFHDDGQSIFKILFDTMFESKDFNQIKKELKKRKTITKWGLLLMEKSGVVHVTDLDGPTQSNESYNVNDTSPLIFTNIPFKVDEKGFENYFKFSENRQTWLKEKVTQASNSHILDVVTNIELQKEKNWIHPCATLSTVGACHINLTKGFFDIKEGDYALTGSDAIVRVNLAELGDLKILKDGRPLRPAEEAWKKIAKAQGDYDQGNYDQAYHELQMSLALMPITLWKEIIQFYLCVWDFKFITNTKELTLVYKKLKKLKVPDLLKDQWVLLVMRMEKKLDLAPTVSSQDVSPELQDLFLLEKTAHKAVFATWMKLLYPRMEILDVFSPHSRT